MSWTAIALIVLALVITVGIPSRLILKRKLSDIDGFGGSAVQKDENDRIIGL